MLVLLHFKQFQYLQNKFQRFRFEHRSFHLHDCRNDRVRKNGLGSISITASFRAIYLPPERIVWSYSQWQPAYTEMLVAIPHIEFVKGIPTALEQDSYFDVNKWNLIVFYDQMIDTDKDKRIVNPLLVVLIIAI